LGQIAHAWVTGKIADFAVAAADCVDWAGKSVLQNRINYSPTNNLRIGGSADQCDRLWPE